MRVFGLSNFSLYSLDITQRKYLKSAQVKDILKFGNFVFLQPQLAYLKVVIEAFNPFYWICLQLDLSQL